MVTSVRMFYYMFLIFRHRPLEKQQLNVPERTLVTVQKNLFALKDFFDKNPHLFHASPGDSTINQEALKVGLTCRLVKAEVTNAESG